MMLDSQRKEGDRFCQGVKHGRIQTIILHSLTHIHLFNIYFVPGSEDIMWVLLPSGIGQQWEVFDTVGSAGG